jgi:3-(3-hydroxy-phenyl)propionate hydroxylase
MLGLDFVGRVFEDNFLIADVVMEASFRPNAGSGSIRRSTAASRRLLHKQPDNVWRIDFQLGLGYRPCRGTQTREHRCPAEGDARRGHQLRAGVELDLHVPVPADGPFHEGRVIFAGDAAHQVSPFGARGANSGLQDTDNLAGS